MTTEFSQIRKKAILRFALAVPVVILMLFLPAGSLSYWQAWLYCSALFIPMFFIVRYFLKNDPKLIERRIKMKEKEKEQKIIVKLYSTIFFIGFLIPGFDFRFQWSNIPTIIAIISNLFVFFSYMLFFLVMKENSFASRIVEVEENQKVITTGPYAIVRHPMYTALSIMYLLTPFALGSYWALIPFAPFPFVLILRIFNEEKVLNAELAGYKEYCEKVKYKLIPHIW